MPYLYPRQNPLDSARNTFSSWDNCMAKSYCKWPVIVAIVVGSLIVFSVVFCIARCICCGAECAICCCKCCTCCCSGGGGRSSGHKRMKSDPRPIYPPTGQPNPYAQAHAAAPPAPPIDNRPFNQQYRAHATPAFTPAQEAPQFATFDSGRKPVNEDSLPAMPSWGDARDVHVQVEEPAVPEKRGDVEMDRLNHTGSATSGSMTGMAAAANTRRSPGPGRSPIQRSPTGDSYGYNQGFEKEPLVGGVGGRSPQPSPVPYNDRPYAQQDDYRRRGSPAQNLSPVYGANDGYSRRSPQPQPYDTRDHYSDNSYNTPHHDTYAQMPEPGRYDSPPPPSYHTNANHPAPYDSFAPAPAQGINRTHTSPTYDNYAPAPAPAPAPGISRTHTSPTYDDHVDATPATQPVSAYPGQRSYTPQSSAYPGQQSYQAFNPGQTSQQYSGVSRKAVDGSYRDI